MSDISNLLIKDSYDYVIQVDPITREVLRIGGSVPTNPIFSSGVTVNGSFKYSNGTEAPGYILISDAFGNATWAPTLTGTTIYALTAVYADGFTLNFTDTLGANIPITITGGSLTYLIVSGDTIVNNLSATTLNVNEIYISGVNIDQIYSKKVDQPKIKSGIVDKSLFSGSPYAYDVIFTNNLPDTNYSVTVTGKDVRIWSVENESISGFTINTNSNVTLKNNTFWQVIPVGEYNV